MNPPPHCETAAVSTNLRAMSLAFRTFHFSGHEIEAFSRGKNNPQPLNLTGPHHIAAFVSKCVLRLPSDIQMSWRWVRAYGIASWQNSADCSFLFPSNRTEPSSKTHVSSTSNFEVHNECSICVCSLQTSEFCIGDDLRKHHGLESGISEGRRSFRGRFTENFEFYGDRIRSDDIVDSCPESLLGSNVKKKESWLY